jgi:hypothetical protein
MKKKASSKKMTLDEYIAKTTELLAAYGVEAIYLRRYGLSASGRQFIHKVK